MDDSDDNYDNDLLNEYENDNSGGPFADEAEEDNTVNEDGIEKGATSAQPIKIKPVVKNPQPKLNFHTLQGPRGLLALNDLFKDFKFRGSGHERSDIKHMLELMEQWAFRLFPKYHFEDTLKRLEALGKKREIQVYMRKIRMDMVDSDIIRNFDDGEDNDDGTNEVSWNEPSPSAGGHDDFDDLLSQQVDLVQASQTPVLSAEIMERIEKNRQLALLKRKEKTLIETTNMDSSENFPTKESL